MERFERTEDERALMELVELCQDDVMRVLHDHYEHFPLATILALTETLGQLLRGAARSAPETTPRLLSMIESLHLHVESANANPPGQQTLH